MLTREDGKLDVTRMSAIVDQIVWLRKHDYEVILVSSGAVAAGRAELHVDHHLDSVEQRQLFSAIGQVKGAYSGMKSRCWASGIIRRLGIRLCRRRMKDGIRTASMEKKCTGIRIHVLYV